MKILVMGSGGVGGYFGAKLAKAGDAVTFVARGAHLAAIRANGLRIKSRTDGEWLVRSPATEDPATTGVHDLVLFCVKAYDTETAAQALRPVVGPDTVVLSLQNGVDNEDILGKIVGLDHVLGGATYVLTLIEAPGVVAHSFGGKIVFGELDGRDTPRARRVLQAFQRAGIVVELSPRIRRVLWEKYLLIAAVAGTTALTRLPIGVVRSVPETRRLYRLIVGELLAVAKAAGVDLTPQAVEDVVAAADGLDPTFTSSLHHDLTHGRRLEIETLHGHAVRLGEQLGVPTPVVFSVYAALRPYRDGAPV